MFIPTRQQRDAIKKLVTWWKSRTRQVFEISGLAGTGKSTMVNAFIEEIGLSPDEVSFAAYTGKASLVLQRKGIHATTIHKLIYVPVPYEETLKDAKGEPLRDKDGRPRTVKKVRFEKKDKIGGSIKLIVLDECSMINEQMWRDLLTFELPIIVLGDKGQLDPVHGEPVLLKNPDVNLTEIVRQAEDSPIIHLSMLAREGRPIPVGRYSAGVHVVPHDSPQVTDKILVDWADIILCGKNSTRTDLNNYIRHDVLGLDSALPVKGDKLICRRNNWNISLPGDDVPLVNGMIGNVSEHIDKETINRNTFDLSFKPDFSNEVFNLSANRLVFESTDIEEIKKEMNYGKGEKFEYGYAITTHLSQGSEWNKVVIYEEMLGGYEKHKKWLYTAITRSSKNLILVQREKKRYF